MERISHSPDYSRREEYEECDDDYNDGGQPPPINPAFPAFYVGKPVVIDVSQLHVGLVVEEFIGCIDPSKGGKIMIVSSMPYVSNERRSLCIDLTDSNGRTRIASLRDHGIMPPGEKPYNQNRLVMIE